MINKFEDFIFGKIAGRMLARLAVSGAAWVVGQAAAQGVHLDANEVSSALIAGANAAYTWLSDWRAKRAAAASAALPAK